MQARFLKPAESEIDEAIVYFDERREGLGDRFEQDLRATVDFVIAHPFSGKPLTERVRKFPLQKFPYSVIYVVDDPEIVIVAIAHCRRRPGYWLSRLAEVR